MAPSNVTKDDEDQIWVRLYGDADTYLKRHRKVDDGAKVCIRRFKGAFDKKYMPNWSLEQFTVSSIIPQANKRRRKLRPMYTLKDVSSEKLCGK